METGTETPPFRWTRQRLLAMGLALVGWWMLLQSLGSLPANVGQSLRWFRGSAGVPSGFWHGPVGTALLTMIIAGWLLCRCHEPLADLLLHWRWRTRGEPVVFRRTLWLGGKGVCAIVLVRTVCDAFDRAMVYAHLSVWPGIVMPALWVVPIGLLLWCFRDSRFFVFLTRTGKGDDHGAT